MSELQEIRKEMLDQCRIEPTVKIGTDGKTIVYKSQADAFRKLVKNGGHVVVTKHYELGSETVVLPHHTVLDFQGGGLRHGTVVGDQSAVIATNRVFTTVKVRGTWVCPGNVLWFADGSEVEERDGGVCEIPARDDASRDIQVALDSSFRELIFPSVPYYVGKTLELLTEKHIIMEGTSLKQGISNKNETIKGTAILFTDKNIPLLRIAVKEGREMSQNTVNIEGGNFDVSLCPDYSSSCIEVRTDGGAKMWGVEIATTVNGRYGHNGGIGIDINPVGNRDCGGYVTQVRIKSNVQNFSTGIRAQNYIDWKTGVFFNWCTDVQIDSNIVDCPTAIDTNCDCSISGMIQAGYFWDERENNVPLIRIGGDRASISANVFDIRLSSLQKFSNWYALEIMMPNASVVANGLFQAFVRLSKNLGQDIVTGQKQAFVY